MSTTTTRAPKAATPTPRLCALEGCGVNIEGKRRGTRFCCRQHADQARYLEQHKDAPPKRRGRPPQNGKCAKTSSAFRQARRVQARCRAETEAHMCGVHDVP